MTELRHATDEGSVTFSVQPTCPPEFLGDLPPEELYLTELVLPWEGDWLGAGRRLFHEALAAVVGTVPDRLQGRTNPEVHQQHRERVELFDAIGLELFQEKEGFTWRDTGAPIEVPDRLSFVTVEQAGRDAYRDVIAAAGEGTLDRNDRYYRSQMDPLDWGSVFLTFMADGEEPMWQLGVLPNDEPVGFVAVSDFDGQGTATITFVGVVPEHRGNSYINDLLAAGTEAARRQGFTAILSDVDTENAPMVAAMERAGHHPGIRPWHIWHHVGSVEQTGASRE